MLISKDSQTKKSIESFECKYCHKSFKRERTLTVHMCQQKHRYNTKDELPSRLAYETFTIFYKTCMSGRTVQDRPPALATFINSPEYNGFYTFGKYLAELKLPVNQQEDFIKFVIQQGVKIKDWSKSFVLEEFIKLYSLKEDPKRAVESVILLAEEWGNENNGHWTEFFDKVSASMATHFIITGRISPWIIYGTNAGQRMVDRLNERELELVVNHINVNTWKHKLKKYPASLNELEIIDETCIT